MIIDNNALYTAQSEKTQNHSAKTDSKELSQNKSKPSDSVVLRHQPGSVEHLLVYSGLIRPVGDDGGGLQNKLQQLANGFASIQESMGLNQQLEDAFGAAVQILFTNAERAQHSRSADVEKSAKLLEQAMTQAKTQANTFTEVFLSNFKKHGTENSFNSAWATIEQMITEAKTKQMLG